MRILTLVTGPEFVPQASRLSHEIRNFNAEIDFRLRFLHIEIEESHVALKTTREALLATRRDDGLEGEKHAAFDDDRADVHDVSGTDPLEHAAGLALLLDRVRPDLFVVAGSGDLAAPGVAAAHVCRIRPAFYATSADGAHGRGAGGSGADGGDEGDGGSGSGGGPNRAHAPDLAPLDLGDDAAGAVERMTGVAREIR